MPVAYLSGIQVSSFNTQPRNLLTDQSKLAKLAGVFLAMLVVYNTSLSRLILFPGMIPILGVAILYKIRPSFSMTRKYSFVKGRTIIPLSCSDVLTKVSSFIKGSQCDHFDTMIKNITQVT